MRPYLVLAYVSKRVGFRSDWISETRNQRRFVDLPKTEGLLLILTIQPSSGVISTPLSDVMEQRFVFKIFKGHFVTDSTF